MIQTQDREIQLQIKGSALDDLSRMLMLRKLTGNDVGEDYIFGFLVFKALMENKTKIVISTLK